MKQMGPRTIEGKGRIIFKTDGNVGSLKGLKTYLKIFKGKVGVIELDMNLVVRALLKNEEIIPYILENTKYRIILELEYDTISKTVANVAEQAAGYGQDRILGFTVCSFWGKDALTKTAKAVRENFKKEPTRPMVIAVTLMKSPRDPEIQGAPKEAVWRWAQIAADTGIPAIVCSAERTKEVLKINPDFTVINESIHFADSGLGTQKRVTMSTTPYGAIKNGADYIIMGSDLCNGNPVFNAQRAIGEILAAEYQPLERKDMRRIFGEMKAVDPDNLILFSKEIAYRSRDLGIEVVCGSALGGASMINQIADWLRLFTGDDSIDTVFADQDGDKRTLFPNKVAHKRVLVVNDVINTGDSTAEIVKAVGKAGGYVVACKVIANQAPDKKAADELISTPLEALLELD
jgi:orotidine-5'-phosphate decarboxylase